MKPQGKLLLPNWRDRQINVQRIKTYWSRNPRAEISVGNSATVGKQLMNCWRLSVDNSDKNSKETQSSKCSTLLWVLPLGALPTAHSEYRGKKPLMLPEGKRKRKHSEIYQSTLFLTKFALSRNDLTRA